MDIFYIDYSNLGEEGYNRILFLERIFRILKLKESIKYDQLDLSPEDLKLFINLINNPSFKPYISVFNNEISLKNNVDGQVLTNINILIDDLSTLLKKIEEKNGINELIEQLNNKITISNKDLNCYFNTLSPLLFQRWLFKYITISFIPHSKYGLKIYMQSLKELNSDKLKRIFKSEFIFKELKLLPKRKINGEIDDEDITNIKYFLLEIIKFIGNLYPDFYNYWFNIRTQVIDLFKEDKTNTKNSNPNLKEYENKISLNSFGPNLEGNLVLFLVKKGDTRINPRNNVISTYNNKIVLFSNSMRFKKKLKVDDMVICEILADKGTYIIADPLKRITNKKDVLDYLKKGIKCESSKKEIIEHLEKKYGK